MTNPKVSILTPTYNGASYLSETIQSVLDQTYPNWELILVDDCSSDHTIDVIAQFSDPRIRSIRHDQNRGSDIARNTGLEASTGEIIAFLDQDDLFHPGKLQAHVEFLKNHPEIGFTYNSHFELNYSASTIRHLSRPTSNMTLEDLVLRLPLPPSDVVLRREWALQMDLVGGSQGAEILHFSRLFMAGCKFGFVDRALNYRRYHSRRRIKNLARGCELTINNQDRVFSDPGFPPSLRVLRNFGHADIYMYWAYLAFIQDETAIGQEFVRNAARLKPSILEGKPCELVSLFFTNCIDDENLNHAELLQQVFAQLPPEMAWLSKQYDWAVPRGYIVKGARAVMWDRPGDGRKHFEEAIKQGATVDQLLIDQLSSLLLDYETEFGEVAAQNVLRAWGGYLKALGGQASVRQLTGSYAINKAFQSYEAREYTKVPKKVVQAVVNDPRYSTNRGVQSIFFRSILGIKPG